jgi:hypothetical protein
MPFNLIDYPIVFMQPRRFGPNSAWIQHIPFAAMLVDMLEPRTIAELGVHHGDSYCAFCQAVGERKSATRCFGVDTWRGDAHAGFYPQQVLEVLRAHHDPLYASFSTLMQSDFDSAAARFDDGSVDLIHIDGFHTCEAVKHDFETWLPKASDRAVMLFHDTVVRQKDFGVWRFWDEVSSRYPSFNFEHGAGLGVLAVGQGVPESFRDWLDAANADPPAMRKLFHGLGLNIERQRLLHALLTQVYHARQIVSQARSQHGMVVGVDSNNPQAITANPLGFVRDMAREIQELHAAQPTFSASG